MTSKSLMAGQTTAKSLSNLPTRGEWVPNRDQEGALWYGAGYGGSWASHYSLGRTLFVSASLFINSTIQISFLFSSRTPVKSDGFPRSSQYTWTLLTLPLTKVSTQRWPSFK